MLFNAAALYWKSSWRWEKIINICVERSKKVPWLNGYIKQIFWPNLTEEFKYVAFVLKENFDECWQTLTQNLYKDQFCVATTGAFWPMCQHLAVPATCCRHVGDFLSNALGLSFVSSLKTMDKRHFPGMTSDNHWKVVYSWKQQQA